MTFKKRILQAFLTAVCALVTTCAFAQTFSGTNVAHANGRWLFSYSANSDVVRLSVQVLDPANGDLPVVNGFARLIVKGTVNGQVRYKSYLSDMRNVAVGQTYTFDWTKEPQEDYASLTAINNSTYRFCCPRADGTSGAYFNANGTRRFLGSMGNDQLFKEITDDFDPGSTVLISLRFTGDNGVQRATLFDNPQ